MRTAGLIALILSISVNILIIEGWRPYSVHFGNISYVVLQPQIVDFEVIQRIVEGREYYSGYANIQKTIFEAFVQIILMFDSGNENYDLMYVNKTFSVCGFLANKEKSVFLGIVHKVLEEYVEIPKQCPLLKKTYRVDKATFNVDAFPPVMPEKKMLLYVSGWITEDRKKVMIGNGSVIVSIENKYKKNDYSSVII